MQLWKLGCRWGSNTPLFYNFIVERNIVVGWIDKDYQVNDWLLITDGHTVLSFANIKSERRSILDYPEWQNDFEKYELPFEEDLFIYNVHYVHLTKEDQFSYPLQKGIVRVQGKEYIEAFNHLKDKYMRPSTVSEIKSILQYKKQIILQGPPGTGKTRLAKELARALTIPSTITESDIRSILSVGLTINSATGWTNYTIKAIGDMRVMVGLANGANAYNPTYKEIIDAYAVRLWEGGQRNGNDPYAAAIAKYMHERFSSTDNSFASSQFKFVQFHPSYSYEDFVRGIVAESKRGQIEYKNVNKIIGTFAEEATKNWIDSRKDIGNISRENNTQQYFERFVDELSEKISRGEVIKLTPSVNVIEVEEDAFRYRGQDGWATLGNRMLFKDIIQAFLDGNKVRQDIKKNKNLSGLAIQHASYFVRVLNLFQSYLESNRLSLNLLSFEKVELKNYVLIIDEINRANLSSVLGELIYALEYRGEKVESMYAVEGKTELVLPPNLYIIGTMNTADRSVGHIDYAIRRRFAFVDVLPEDLSAELNDKFHKPLFNEVSALFEEYLSPEFEKKDVQLGHSYFIDKTSEGGSMAIRLQYEIKPILREYAKDGILVGNDIAQVIEKLTV